MDGWTEKPEPCDICGKPATSGIIDKKVETWQRDDAGLKWPNYEVHSTHFRCGEHNRIPRVYVADVMTEKAK